LLPVPFIESPPLFMPAFIYARLTTAHTGNLRKQYYTLNGRQDTHSWQLCLIFGGQAPQTPIRKILDHREKYAI